uniref:Uncharacterized protein n=1 Tax=Sipha flava TaxID=143950 RepID=A0A2S2Q5C1_9HEMI
MVFIYKYTPYSSIDVIAVGHIRVVRETMSPQLYPAKSCLALFHRIQAINKICVPYAIITSAILIALGCTHPLFCGSKKKLPIFTVDDTGFHHRCLFFLSSLNCQTVPNIIDSD